MKAIYGSPLSSLVKIHPIMQEEMYFEAIVDDRQRATETTTAHFDFVVKFAYYTSKSICYKKRCKKYKFVLTINFMLAQ